MMPLSPLTLLGFGGAIAASLALTGCAELLRRGAPEASPSPSARPAPQVSSVRSLAIRPLPGGLDDMLVLNSNSPEIVQQEGILVSTRRASTPADRQAYLDLAFEGRFQVFSHHIAKDETPGARLLHLGLVAENTTRKPVTLRLQQGASYLSQPEALFKPLEPVVKDPEGEVYAGPGDRVATDLLHGRSPMRRQSWTLPPGGSVLIYNLPIPTDVAILPPVNGRTTQLELQSDGPVRLSEVALFAEKHDGRFVTPRLADYTRLLDSRVTSGPREPATVISQTGSPAPGPFRYGRVAGISKGATWHGALDPVEADETVGYPVSAVHLNRLGTSQVQSAPLVRRYEGTASQAHGNYGVTYALDVPLVNNTSTPRTFSLTLSNPAKAEGKAPDVRLRYLEPPNRMVMFRGPVKVDWQDPSGRRHTTFSHVVTRHGEAMPPFARIEVPPFSRVPVNVSLIYPADATPPQLLTVSGSPAAGR